MGSTLEDLLLLQLRAAGLPEPARELQFAKPRRWRWDFCWPDRWLAVEVEGMTWAGGRHTRGRGYHNDLEKHNAANLLGWRLLRFDRAMVEDGTALQVIERALGGAN